MIKHILFYVAEFYSSSYALYELNHGNRQGFVAVISAVIISFALFVKYST